MQRWPQTPMSYLFPPLRGYRPAFVRDRDHSNRLSPQGLRLRTELQFPAADSPAETGRSAKPKRSLISAIEKLPAAKYRAALRCSSASVSSRRLVSTSASRRVRLRVERPRLCESVLRRAGIRRAGKQSLHSCTNSFCRSGPPCILIESFDRNCIRDRQAGGGPPGIRRDDPLSAGRRRQTARPVECAVPAIAWLPALEEEPDAFRQRRQLRLDDGKRAEQQDFLECPLLVLGHARANVEHQGGPACILRQVRSNMGDPLLNVAPDDSEPRPDGRCTDNGKTEVVVIRGIEELERLENPA